MPGEICLKCAECGAVTKYTELYQHGQYRPKHLKDCKQEHEMFAKMYLTQAENPLP